MCVLVLVHIKKIDNGKNKRLDEKFNNSVEAARRARPNVKLVNEAKSLPQILIGLVKKVVERTGSEHFAG